MPAPVDETLQRMREAWKRLPLEERSVPQHTCRKCGAPANIQFGSRGHTFMVCALCAPKVHHNFAYNRWMEEPPRRPLRDSRNVRYNRCKRCRSYRCNCPD